MTRKLFWQDPYQTQLTTTITALDGNELQVAETIFYAFSGGQESDSGSIAERPVVNARKHEQTIIYTLNDTQGLAVGDSVTMQIDWPRRYALMRLHFAAEIILELVMQQFKGIEKIGAHIAQDKARIDFLANEPLTPHLMQLKAQAQHFIQADLPITSAFSDETQGRRYWQIAGFAQVSCGGTHLKRSSEVGELNLKRKNVGKGKERIEIYLV